MGFGEAKKCTGGPWWIPEVRKPKLWYLESVSKENQHFFAVFGEREAGEGEVVGQLQVVVDEQLEGDSIQAVITFVQKAETGRNIVSDRGSVLAVE
jgi:hypothetical protein